MGRPASGSDLRRLRGLAAAALLSLGLAACPGPTASYRGRPAADWSRDLAAEDAGTRDRAVASLAAGGADALPVLTALADSDDASLRRAALTIVGLADLPAERAVPVLLRAGVDEDEEVRFLGVSALRRYPDAGSAAVDRLGRILEGDSSARVRAVAAEALGILAKPGSAIQRPLVAALEDGSGAVRAQAACSLKLLGCRTPECLKALRRLMDDPDARAQVEGALALGAAGPVALPFLTDALRASSRECRLGALVALAHMGPDAKPALDAVRELLDSEDVDLRAAARVAIEKIGVR